MMGGMPGGIGGMPGMMPPMGALGGGLGGNAALGGGLSALLGQTAAGNNLGLNLGGSPLTSLTSSLGGTTSAGGLGLGLEGIKEINNLISLRNLMEQLGGRQQVRREVPAVVTETVQQEPITNTVTKTQVVRVIPQTRPVDNSPQITISRPALTRVIRNMAPQIYPVATGPSSVHATLPAVYPSAIQSVASAINVRDDRRCGPKFPLNGAPSTCNPHGTHPCCSQWGWCGSSDAHCACPGCVDT